MYFGNEEDQKCANTALNGWPTNGQDLATKVTFGISGNCRTIDGDFCVSGAWIWSEGPGIFAHYVNCIPMTGEGRNIFNLAGQPNAIEGQDYEFYCPITLDDEGKVNKNQPNYFVVMKRCQLPLEEGEESECRTTETLEQTFSTSDFGM